MFKKNEEKQELTPEQHIEIERLKEERKARHMMYVVYGLKRTIRWVVIGGVAGAVYYKLSNRENEETETEELTEA